MNLKKSIEAKSNLTVRGQNLYLHDINLAELAREHGTPLYIVDGNRILEKYKALDNAMSRTGLDYLITYAYKANSTPQIVGLLARQNAGATVTSAYGIRLALNYGVIDNCAV